MRPRALAIPVGILPALAGCSASAPSAPSEPTSATSAATTSGPVQPADDATPSPSSAAQEPPAQASGTDTSWGGVTFPSQVGEHRLVSPEEFNAYVDEVADYWVVCAFIRSDLEDEDPQTEAEGLDPHDVEALYTTIAPGALASTIGDCENLDQVVVVTVARNPLPTMYTDPGVTRDANGAACSNFIGYTCAMPTSGGYVMGQSSAADGDTVPPVSDIMAAVAATNP